MALLTAAHLNGFLAGTPVGGTSLANASDPVTLTLSDGSIVTVFDTIATALACLEWCHTRAQRRVAASPGILMVAIDDAKLLIGQRWLMEELLRDYVPCYGGGVVSFLGIQGCFSLSGALAALGLSSADTFPDNASLQAASLPLVLLDWNYTAPGGGTQFADPTPLVYRSLQLAHLDIEKPLLPVSLQ